MEKSEIKLMKMNKIERKANRSQEEEKIVAKYVKKNENEVNTI